MCLHVHECVTEVAITSGDLLKKPSCSTEEGINITRKSLSPHFDHNHLVTPIENSGKIYTTRKTPSFWGFISFSMKNLLALLQYNTVILTSCLGVPLLCTCFSVFSCFNTLDFTLWIMRKPYMSSIPCLENSQLCSIGVPQKLANADIIA